MFPLSHMLKSFVRVGTLKVIDAGGAEHVFAGTADGPNVTMRLKDRSLYTKLFFNPELHAGEAYMDGRLTFENSTLRDFLTLFSVNRVALGTYPLQKGAAPHLQGAAGDPAGQPDRQGARERRPSLRSRQRLLRALPGRGHAVFVRLLPRRWRQPGVGPAEQAAADRLQAQPEARPQDPRHRERLGRPGAVPGGDGGRERHGCDAVARAVCALHREGAPGRASRSRAFRAARLPGACRPL